MAHGKKKPILKYGFDKVLFLNSFYDYIEDNKLKNTLTKENIKIIFEDFFNDNIQKLFDIYEITNKKLNLIKIGLPNNTIINENEILMLDSKHGIYNFWNKTDIIDLLSFEISFKYGLVFDIK